MQNSTKTARTFMTDEDGAATPLAIGLVVMFIVLGGLAVDFNKGVSERTQMQLATDTAAHAALYSREFQDVDVSRDAAMMAITGMLPEVAYNDALRDTDIEFGFWDPATSQFTADSTFVEDKDDRLRSAVRARAQLEPGRNNQSRNILLPIIGQDAFTIRTSTTYATFYPPCTKQGLLAHDVVDMQSNSFFLDGICLHSNKYVSLNQNNVFEPGTVVSMPDLADLDIPASGFEKNDGLQAALRQGKYRLRILRQMPLMFASLRAGSVKYAETGGVTQEDDVLYPIDMTGKGQNAVTAEDIEAAFATGEYSTAAQALPRMSSSDTGKKNVVPQNFLPANRIYRLECTGNGDITFSGDTFRNFVIVTNCPVRFSNGAVLENVLIATENDVSASHVQIGANDNCAPGGNASIWTYGTFSSASGLQAFGAQILAQQDILFTAQANGIEGVNFIAGGMIDGTSSGEMGFCDEDAIENFVSAPYYRAVN